MGPQPFSYTRLPRWQRGEVVRLRRVLRHLQPLPTGSRPVLDGAWENLLGGTAVAWPQPPAVLSATDLTLRGLPHGAATVAAVAQHPTLGVMAVLADRTPALTLAARALGHTGHEALTQGLEADLTPALEGALALLVARAAVLAWAPSPPPAVRAITDSVAVAMEALGDPNGDLFAWTWRYTVGTVGGTVTLVIPVAATLALAPTVWTGDASVMAARVPVAVVLGRASLRADHLAGCAPGDVLTLDGMEGSAGHWSGTVDVAVGGGAGEHQDLRVWSLAVPGVVGPDGRTRLTGAAAPWRARTVMDPNDGDPAVKTEVLAGLIVEVTVEIAHGTATVGEVSAWRVGEVITVEQPLGDPVTVRAGGRVVARGELVDVDGTVGVRITARV